MKHPRKDLFAADSPFRLVARPAPVVLKQRRERPPTRRVGTIVSGLLVVLRTPEAWLVAALLLSAATANAREPSATDKAFCDRYAVTLQQALDVERSGDPVAVARFRQSVINDPQAYLIMPGLGVPYTTPPWVTDITAESRQFCLAQVKFDQFSPLPGDRENRSRGNSPEAHIGTITRLPSVNEAPTVAPSAPPPDDVFEGSFDGPMRPITVVFQRHALICLGGTQAQVMRQGLAPATTCSIRETPTAYVVRFPQSSSFGEVTIPYATMRPAKAAKATVE